MPLATEHFDALTAQSVNIAHFPLSQRWTAEPAHLACPFSHSEMGATHVPSWQTAPFAHMSADHLPPSVQNWTTSVLSGWQRVSPDSHSGAGACRHFPFRQNSSLPHA